jgi:hypothetical protein
MFVYILLNLLKMLTLVTCMQRNDYYEFPLELDLGIDDGKYLSPDADREMKYIYTLHRSVGYFSIFLSFML